MSTPTPPPADDINPAGCLVVVGICIGLFVMFSPNREKKAVVDSAPTMRTETPQPRRPDPKLEPKRELTEAELIARHKASLRKILGDERPLLTLEKLAKTSIPRSEIVDLIVERMLLIDFDSDGLATYLAAHYGKAGVAAYLKAHPKGVVWPRVQNDQPSDRR